VHFSHSSLRQAMGSIQNGIHGLMREWGCGHGNMEAPRTLNVGGFGQVFVDIGLGIDGIETLTAARQGFVVFGFDPVLANVHSVLGRLGTSLPVEQVEIGMQGGRWRPTTALLQPTEPKVFLFHAAVGDVDESVDVSTASLTNMGSIKHSGSTASSALTSVPQVRLDSILPKWASSVHLLKIDTQGYELRVLRGAIRSLRAHRFRYVLYELSPWLMLRERLGDPLELLRLLPGLGFVCFDMMGQHNMFPHTQKPLEAYFDELVRGNNSYLDGNQLPASGVVPSDGIGPWDDVMCWDPEAASRDVPMKMTSGHKKYFEVGSFAKQRGRPANHGNKIQGKPAASHHKVGSKEPTST